METKIKIFENDATNINPSQLERKLRDLNEELNDKLSNLDSEVEEEFISSCTYEGENYKYNNCDNCKINCHDVCDCNFSIQNEIDRQLHELNFNREKIFAKKEKNTNEKNEIEKKILTTNNNITFIIIQLKNMSDKIDSLAMNTNNIKTEDKFIDSLKNKMNEIGFNDEEQIKAMDTMKKQNKIYTEIKNKKI